MDNKKVYRPNNWLLIKNLEFWFNQADEVVDVVDRLHDGKVKI